MRPMMLLGLLTACSGPGTPDDTGGADDTGEPSGCRAGQPRPDATRFVALSHPYDPSGGQADAWEVLALSPEGELSRTDARFTLGRSVYGPVRFSADGSLGLAVLDDGSVGVFLLDDEGVPSVVGTFADDGAGGEFYASDVRIDPSGESAWVLDGNWPENGGGVYGLDLDCTTGAPTATGFVAASKLGAHLLPLPGGDHLLVGREVLGHTGDVHRIDLSGPDVSVSASLWPDDEASVGGATLAGDGGYVVVGDNSGFSSVPNRVAVARIDGDALTPVQVLFPIEDPASIAAWGRATLVASGFGDALFPVTFNAGAEQPFTLGSALATSTAVQIPGTIAVAAGPGGDGWMLVPEVTAVRVVRATADGVLSEASVLDLGDGYTAIAGALGVQP